MEEKTMALIGGAILLVIIISAGFYFANSTKDNVDELDENFKNRANDVFGTYNYQTPEERLQELGVQLAA